MEQLGTVLGEAWRLWSSALALHPDPDTADRGWWPFVLIAAVATLSSTVGRSVVLFLNRMRGGALLFSLGSSLVVMLVWSGLFATALWGGARLVLGSGEPSIGVLTRIVIVALAPQAFSFVTVIPLLGPILDRALQVWTLLVLWTGATAVWEEAAAWRVGTVMVLAALVMVVGQTLLAPTTARVRDAIWRRVTGRPLHASSHYLLELAQDVEQ